VKGHPGSQDIRRCPVRSRHQEARAANKGEATECG
jgi:hypothetical protein